MLMHGIYGLIYGLACGGLGYWIGQVGFQTALTSLETRVVALEAQIKSYVQTPTPAP
jgi:hypothetical protein